MDVRIYYEDTDAGGVVYHANYLRYMERARTEFFRDRDLSVAALAADGFAFPVVHMELNFKAPAYHDDLLSISVNPVRVGGSSVTVCHRVVRTSDEKLLVEGTVTLACIGHDFKARRIPVTVRNMLEAEAESCR